ncbi:hypothetical protein K504DRAFT_467884 [Pleomassaria siparia CBS 279.74]|uniref:Uncharacterized protein n=1 Tax=Pleomassaria siparia CBS 279.74 TaxID=1314801 RepID=A0A6G1K7Y6_9PLEO|nr:hypothetical protein K504DRAFT_467884 [Pleomassaria siparia CBS 279.74]
MAKFHMLDTRYNHRRLSISRYAWTNIIWAISMLTMLLIFVAYHYWRMKRVGGATERRVMQWIDLNQRQDGQSGILEDGHEMVEFRINHGQRGDVGYPTLPERPYHGDQGARLGCFGRYSNIIKR